MVPQSRKDRNYSPSLDRLLTYGTPPGSRALQSPLTTAAALDKAQAMDLDLILIAPMAIPAVA